MRNWHSLFEILEFPTAVLLVAAALLGLGNLLTNSAFGSLYSITNESVILAAEVMKRIGTFLIVNFPLLFIFRLVSRKTGSAVSIISAFCGYAAYLMVTMYFAPTTLVSTAYSSILGISVSGSAAAGASATTRYPLQTGVLATVIVSLVTLASYTRSRNRSEYGFFSFVSKDVHCVLRTVLLCSLCALGICYLWPYVVKAISAALEFIANDTTNPINLALYGVLDRLLSVFNLNALIRTPFWYGSSGGTWINIAGGNIAGDVNIWTKQLAASSLTGMAGRFITPYYVLNIFAVPGMIWAMYSLQTDKLERSRMRMLFILATIISMLSGTLLPLELMLFILCPLLFLFHLGYTGILFGVFQAMHVYLGYNSTGTNTIAGLPGTLMEFLSYIPNYSLTKTLLLITAVGAVSFFIYFGATRLYFNHLALDLFNTGDADRLVKGTIKAVGGIENVKMIHSSINRLTISVYDPTKLDVIRLKNLGSVRVYETKAGYAISYGAASTMVSRGIQKNMRETIRSVRQ